MFQDLSPSYCSFDRLLSTHQIKGAVERKVFSINIFMMRVGEKIGGEGRLYIQLRAGINAGN